MAKILGFFLLLVLVFLIVAVALLNPSTVVNINLFFGKFVDVPLVLALFVAFLLGALMTFLYLVGSAIKQKLRIRQLGGRIREYEQELTAIRNIPVEGASTPVEEESVAPGGRG